MAIEDFNQVTIEPAKLRPFSRFIMSIGELPTSYLDSLSYAEQVTWFCDYLQNNVIPAVNNNAEALEEVQNLMTQLQEYVDNYFTNLDVQEEINNKLDSLVEDGTLTALIGNYVDPLIEAQNTRISLIENEVENAVSGSPLVASSTAGMTDTSRIYVNTTDGKWYYYDGDSWEIGGTYQSSGISNSDPIIQNIDRKFNYYSGTITESTTLPFQVNAGETVIIDISAITGGATLFIEGYTGYSIQLAYPTTYKFTAQNAGKLRFYIGGANVSITFKLIIETDLFKASENYQYIKQEPNLNSLPIKTNIVHDSLDMTSTASYNFLIGISSIENYTDYVVNSSVSHPTTPIRLRNNDGTLIYKNLHISGSTTEDQTGVAAWFFGKNGKFLRFVQYKDMDTRDPKIATDEYYAILNEFPSVSGYTDLYWEVDNVNIEWLNQTNKEIYTVDPNGNGDYTTFTEMLEDLENNNNEKIVYINPGTYDIFNEMGGAEYIATIADTASELNWRDVCHVVPPNTHIIGLGEVNLTWLATSQEMVNGATAFLFSPLNISGTCTIENINVTAQNCRYAVHDEVSGQSQYNKSIHHYINCNFNYLQSSLGVGYTYGAGHSKEMVITFDNCNIYSYGETPFSSHDWQPATATEKAFITFNNCIFRSDDHNTYCNVRFSSSDTTDTGRKDSVKFNNCYINNTARIVYSTEGTYDVKQGYEVTLIGCTYVTEYHSPYVTVTYPTVQYNSFN